MMAVVSIGDKKLKNYFFVLWIQFHPGKNVGIGRDYTIYSLIDGLVKFEKFGPDRKKVRARNFEFTSPEVPL
jgi:hypothetical protein